jgi:hypothetical protein
MQWEHIRTYLSDIISYISIIIYSFILISFFCDLQKAKLRLIFEVVQEYTADPDWSTFEIICTTIEGIEERAKMEKGPDGFIIGKFGKHVVVLDAPNLMLVSAQTSKETPSGKTMKVKPMKKMKKKPAAADGSAKEKEADVDDADIWDKPKQAHDPILLTLASMSAHPMCIHCAFNVHSV